jgi:hypothetical protein
MKRFTMMLAAVLLLVGAAYGPAKAATIGLDPSPTDDASFFLLKGSAAQKVSFTLTQVADVTIDLLGLGIPHVNLSLLQCTNASCTTTSAVGSSGGSGPTGLGFLSTAEFTYAGLLANTKYLINITGAPLIGLGIVLGQISAVAATPIPASLLMFLTALGGLGFVAKRRKSLAGAAA